MSRYYQNQGNMDPVADLLAGEHPVAYRVSFARVCGGACPALLLSQMYFWGNTKTAQERDGWFYMTQAQITEQTGLSLRETETARKRLREAGILREEKRGLPMKLWFQVDKAALYRLLRTHLGVDTDTEPNLRQNVEDCGDKTRKIAARNVEDCQHENASHLLRNVENTTNNFAKTPSEISTETTSAPLPAPEPTVVVPRDKEIDALCQSMAVILGSTQSAERLIRDHGRDVCERQLSIWGSRRPLKNPGGMFARSIKENWDSPELAVPYAQKKAARHYVKVPSPASDSEKSADFSGLSPSQRFARLRCRQSILSPAYNEERVESKSQSYQRNGE
ncbi:MAG: hypothetical protein V4671_14800 [Armatimonadota bacterium]